MEMQNSNSPMLELLLRPAFYVTDGRISELNQGATAYLLNIGDDVLSLISTGLEEYQSFQDGCLYLTLSIADKKIDTTIIAFGEKHLFILDQDAALTELRTLSLAARELRTPLTGMLSAAGQLLQSEPDPLQLSQFNRRMYQIMRIISNMSDAIYYCESTTGRMEYVQICAFLDEMLEKAQLQLHHAGFTLQYTLPKKPIYTLADTEKLERAVYNLISNAAKHTPPNGTIKVSLTHRNQLYLSVVNTGCSGDNHVQANAYYRYLRTPSVYDSPDGIGLGMVLIRATAALHNGTVLIDCPNKQSTRVTMTLELRQGKTVKLRSPISYPDYAGERDHGLQELSDVLPASLYAQEDFF